MPALPPSGRWRRAAAASLLAWAAVQLPLDPAPARAHAIDSSLERVAGLSRTLELQSHFSSGEPAAGAKVSLVAPNGTTLALGTTDAQGQLRFQIPAAADAAWEVRVDQGPGHRDYLELPVAPERGTMQSSGRIHPWAATPLLLLGALLGWPGRRGA